MTPRILILATMLCFADANTADAQNRAGTYVYQQSDNASGEIRVTRVNTRSLTFTMGIGSRNPACVGQFSNRAYWIAANVAEYKPAVKDTHSCRLIFVFSGNDLIVRECDCGNFHGASCTFAGSYRRLSQPNKK